MYSHVITRRTALALLAGVPAVVWGQAEGLSLEDLLQAGQALAQEYLDEDFLKSFGEFDAAQVRPLLEKLMQEFQQDYVLDLAALKDAVRQALPLLEAHDETRPYAIWLRARSDYFEAAEEFRRTAPPPPPPPQGQPPKRPPNPKPQEQRTFWQKLFSKRPRPTAADEYVARLKPVFAARKLPTELVWLAEVESAFNPKAKSPVGAAGLFQLMPGTARALGLSLLPSDQRLDPEKSADAAARYLNHLRGRFADWPLAVAAYNAGEGKVGGLLTKYKARTFDEVAIHLPAETQMYVPKMNATLLRREGKTLAKLAAPGR